MRLGLIAGVGLAATARLDFLIGVSCVLSFFNETRAVVEMFEKLARLGCDFTPRTGGSAGG